MANENSYETKHVVLPVYNRNSDSVDNVAVPQDTSLQDLHSSLMDANYHQIPTSVKQPTAEGSIEHSALFKGLAKDAWVMGDLGGKSGEAGTYLDSNGKPGKLAWNDSPRGERASVKITEPSDAMAAIHTHPNDRTDKPSDDDVDIAKRVHKAIFVVSRSGLWSVDPGGAVSHVFQDPGWMEKKNVRR